MQVNYNPSKCMYVGIFALYSTYMNEYICIRHSQLSQTNNKNNCLITLKVHFSIDIVDTRFKHK